MSGQNTLAAAFEKTTYQVGGNAKRNVQVLQNAFQNVDGSVESDMYGTGKVIADFQNKMAEYLGKESAVFFPSGTMAQQVAMRVWSDRKGLKKVAYHPLCHLEIHEQNGLYELHGIESVLLGEKSRLIQVDEILHLQEDVACILLELPQREIGGLLPTFAELEAISAHCRKKGIKLHLDGARLFETLPYYQKTAAEICQLFDSVYVSFYKGVGSIAGAILAGDAGFTKDSSLWKWRYGGNMISLYPYIISADYYFDQRVPKMELFHAQAKELAGLYNECQSVTTKPEVPVTNMFHVHIALPKETLEPIFSAICETTDVGLTHYVKAIDEQSCYFEVSIGDRYGTVLQERLRKAFQLLDEKIKETL